MVIAFVIITGTILAVLLIHRATRYVLHPEPEQDTKDLAGSILFRISALHGLVLALVFASEVVEYHQLELESAAEVNAVSDIYYDALRYSDEKIGQVRAAVVDYLDAVVRDEWTHLAEQRVLHPRAWAAWDAAYEAILDLDPVSVRQNTLQDNMVSKMHRLAENRDLREYHAKSELSALFWMAAIAGVVLISAAYYIYAPKRDNVILLSAFGAYTGFILFTIFAMSNPFAAPGALGPDLFADLLAELSARE